MYIWGLNALFSLALWWVRAQCQLNLTILLSDFRCGHLGCV